jgi:putative colanic acid biosynthesis acetyltransferase WcaF
MNPAAQSRRLQALPPITFGNRVRRAIWQVAWLLLFRPSPSILHGWRRMLLRMFGAQIEKGAHIYPSAKIFAPWHLRMGKTSCLAEGVDCYNVAPVRLGDHATVSQRAFLCTASHDFDRLGLPLIGAPIILEDYSWATSESFVAPGVTLEVGAVALARSVVTKDVPAWTVVAGNPARVVRMRRRRDGAPATQSATKIRREQSFDDRSPRNHTHAQ